MAEAFPPAGAEHMEQNTEDVDHVDVRWATCLVQAAAGAPPLDVHTAASLGDEVVVSDSLSSDPTLALARNALGWSPIMFAVWQGHEALLPMLLDACRSLGQDPAADPTVGRLPRSGRTLLMVASRFGYLRIASTLCQPSSLEMRDFRGQTAIFHAVRGGNEGLIFMLVGQGANVNAYDLQGQTVLKLAERCRSSNTCEMLRQAGAQLEPRPAMPRPTQSPVELTLENVLEGLALQKYIPLFQLQRINLHGFLALTEEDLRSMGVSLLGPRRRMTLEIDRLRSLFGMNQEASLGQH